MSRKKQEALPVPGSDIEALAMAEDYVAAERSIARARLIAEQLIDQIKAERDATIAAFALPNAQRFAALKAWWEAGGKAMAGKKRSAELAGAVLGIRLTTPAVKFAKGVTVNAVMAWLRRCESYQYLRTNVELDKPAIIKACEANHRDRGAFELEGVTVVQNDEFFIDCRIEHPAKTAEVPG